MEVRKYNIWKFRFSGLNRRSCRRHICFAMSYSPSSTYLYVPRKHEHLHVTHKETCTLFVSYGRTIIRNCSNGDSDISFLDSTPIEPENTTWVAQETPIYDRRKDPPLDSAEFKVIKDIQITYMALVSLFMNGLTSAP